LIDRHGQQRLWPWRRPPLPGFLLHHRRKAPVARHLPDSPRQL